MDKETLREVQGLCIKMAGEAWEAEDRETKRLTQCNEQGLKKEREEAMRKFFHYSSKLAAYMDIYYKLEKLISGKEEIL